MSHEARVPVCAMSHQISSARLQQYALVIHCDVSQPAIQSQHPSGIFIQPRQHTGLKHLSEVICSKSQLNPITVIVWLCAGSYTETGVLFKMWVLFSKYRMHKGSAIRIFFSAGHLPCQHHFFFFP